MNKDNIFTMASVQDEPIDAGTIEDLKSVDSMIEFRKLVASLVAECYGWPVEKEEHIYGVKPKLDAPNPKDPKNPEVKMPKGPNTLSAVNKRY